MLVAIIPTTVALLLCIVSSIYLIYIIYYDEYYHYIIVIFYQHKYNSSSCIIQLDLIGQSIYDFTHPCDHDEIKEVVSEKPTLGERHETSRTFFMRLKCTLTSNGRNINLKSANYKVKWCCRKWEIQLYV